MLLLFLNTVLQILLLIGAFYINSRYPDVFNIQNMPTPYTTQIQVWIIVLLAGGISFLINFSIDRLRRSVTLNITQENSVTKKNCTDYIPDQVSQNFRTIKLTLTMPRRKGLRFFIRQYLKKHRIFILVECNPQGLELQAKNEMLLESIIPSKTGFYIDITKDLELISRHDSTATPSKTYSYIIKEFREPTAVLSGDCNLYINPELRVDEKKENSFFLREVLNWKAEQHQIDFKIGS